MELSRDDMIDLASVATAAATSAGQLIVSSRHRAFQRKDGVGSLASQVITAMDRLSEETIVDMLRPTIDEFGLGLLAEETEDDGGRLATDYFWCIDPIDGTLPYIEGVPGYAVSIALVGRDGTPFLGVVYDPVAETLFHAIKEVGSFRNGVPWPAHPLGRGGEVLSVFASRSFLDADDYDAVMEALGVVARNRGLAGVELHATAGAVMNACSVLENPPACYLTFPKPVGGPSLWDHAATACLFIEAGAIATDMYGAPLDLNRADSTFMNHRGALYVTDEALGEEIRQLLNA